MLLINAFPYLAAYHAAEGFQPDQIEEIVQRAWNDGAAPEAVFRDRNGTWLNWRDVANKLEPERRARVLSHLCHRALG